MKLTFGRWCAIALVGCLLLGVTILPADGEPGLARWFGGDGRAAWSMWSERMRARSMHMYDLARTYEARRDLDAATRAFGSSQGKVGDPEVRFGNEVPAALRTQVSAALENERARRPKLKGNGKVGVLVVIDTARNVNGVPAQHVVGRSYTTDSRVIAPSPATGDRCVVLLKLPNPDPWSARGRQSPAPHPLLDACGFYDAFGAPGPAIAQELKSSNFRFARGFTESAHDNVRSRYIYLWPSYGGGTGLGRCLAGDDSWCLDLWKGTTGDFFRFPGEWPGGSTTRSIEQGKSVTSPLSNLAFDIGPQRFARIWQSQKTLEDAYFDETGEKLAATIRHAEEYRFGVYHEGPWNSWASTMLTVLGIATCIGLAIWYGGRPRVA